MRYTAITAALCACFSSHAVSQSHATTLLTSSQKKKLKTEQTPSSIEKIHVRGSRNSPSTEPTEETQRLLATAGIDNDPLAAIFSLPGVVYGGGDYGGEPAIRGSSPDDNAFFVDDSPVEYIFHLFGDSIFNKNLVRSFDLYSAAYGAAYSDATGGVFDVKLRDPRHQNIKTTLDASFLKVGVFTEGSVTNNQAFYFSYRHSLLQLFFPEGDEDEGVKVFEAPISDDYQGKYQWLIGDSHKITFSLGGASDKLGLSFSEQSEEGRTDPDIVGDAFGKTAFDSQSIRWDFFPNRQYQFSSLVSHVSETQNEYFGDNQFIDVDENTWLFRTYLKTNRFKRHGLKAGLDIEKRKVDYSINLIPYFCTEQTNNCVDQKGDRIQDRDTLDIAIMSGYIEDTWTLHPDWQLTSSLRAEKENYSDSRYIMPRVRLNWMPRNDLRFHFRAGKYSQLQEAEYTVRLLGNPDLKPIESSQLAVGTNWSIDDLWSLSAEAYFKDIIHYPRAIELDKDIAQRRYTNDVSGEAKGLELLLEKAKGNQDWHTWLSVSWSTSDRTDEITRVTNRYQLDTPVVINWVYNIDLSDSWSLGLRYTFRSGARYSPIIAIKQNPDFPDNFLPVYGELNSRQLPNYSRLDLQADYVTRYYGYDATWTFALINALASDNISGYYYEAKEGDTLSNYTIGAEEGIGVFPSFGFSISF
ncbi:TonB-dependent receptor plug domain-containing protein [Agaribacter flavus]|uniref:TonB-dependent receptor plug domain-containing protein n=1 Tax=Agaribacter flavus TaxID=1902781 RepID=A0ABV7FL86_9ALTE